MAPNTKRVFYVKYLPSAVFPTVLAKRPDVQLDKLENDSPNDQVVPILTQAHVYQIGASRQCWLGHLTLSPRRRTARGTTRSTSMPAPTPGSRSSINPAAIKKPSPN